MEETEVLIIGAAIIDVLVRPASEEVFHTGSYPAEEICMSPGGDALNEASVLAELGDAARLETVLGQDRAGRYLQDYCRESGIRLRTGCARSDLATGVNVVLVREDGGRSFLTNKNGSLRSLRLSDIAMPFPKKVRLISFASIFVFPHIGAEELETLFRQAKNQGITVCADMTKCKNGERAEDMSAAFHYVDYLFANYEEAALLTGGNQTEEKRGTKQAAGKLMEAGARCVVIKCGAMGCYVRNDRKEFWSPAVKNVNCVDTTGAGDSFVAGFIHGLLHGETVEGCAKCANACGARAVEKLGTGHF